MILGSGINVEDNSLTIASPIGDGGNFYGITVTGSGTLDLSGTSSYTGVTTVSGGILDVAGDISASCQVELNGGTLTGGGYVPDITSTGGSLVPGGSPGILHSGAVTLGGETGFFVELGGTMAGTGYSQLVASGAQSTSAARCFNCRSTTRPTPGDQLTIIKNNSGLPIAGKFAGLAEGGIFTISGAMFQVSYVGGTSGQDVVLTNVASTTTTVTSTSSTSVSGQPIIFTATVLASPASPPAP